MCDYLRLAGAQIPVLDARGDGNILDRVPVRPLQGGGRILVLTSADLFNDSVGTRIAAARHSIKLSRAMREKQDEW